MRYNMAIILAALLGIAAFTMFPISGASTIGYSDPVGDLENEGMPSDVIPNVDIVEVRVDDSSDPVVAELEVDGIIDYEETYDHERLYYHYHINFDTDGDNVRNCWIEIDSNANTYVFHVAQSSNMEDLTGMYSGQGTSTLRVEVTKAWFGGGTIMDINAETTVGDLMDYCDDDVNENFQGGAAIDDDDDVVDDDDIEVIDDDDDTTDDDDNDVVDDDDDTADDDDGEQKVDDSPGPGILMVPSILAAVMIGLLWGRRKR